MRYLQVGDVARLHCKALNIDEPAEVIYDLGLLESAVMRPQQMVGGVDAYADIHTKAAALFYSLCRNHAFVDGNKRTALMAIGTFYGLNGWWIEVEDGEVVALAVDVAEGPMDVASIAGTLKGWVTALLPEDYDGDLFR
jgi:death-on-curing protein